MVGIDDPDWGERISVAIELRAGATLALEELQSWSKARLAPYKVPKAMICIPSLPRNTMGKVLKPEVARLFNAEPPQTVAC